MTTGRPSWRTLNAYVDGELPAPEAAAVARALAHDRALAHQVASLTRLKATVQDEVEPIELAWPRPRRRIWRPAALAASLLLACALGLAAALAPWREAGAPKLLAQAQTLHLAWTALEGRPATPVRAGVVLATLHRLGPQAYLPDLSAARLTLGWLQALRLPGDAGPALHVGYRGTRGCKISLLVVRGGAGLPEALARYDEAALTTYAWRSGAHGYLLTAEGMDENRLELIARTVQRASLERSPFDGKTRTALRRSRERSVPCLV